MPSPRVVLAIAIVLALCHAGLCVDRDSLPDEWINAATDEGERGVVNEDEDVPVDDETEMNAALDVGTRRNFLTVDVSFSSSQREGSMECWAKIGRWESQKWTVHRTNGDGYTSHNVRPAYNGNANSRDVEVFCEGSGNQLKTAVRGRLSPMRFRLASSPGVYSSVTYARVGDHIEPNSGCSKVWSCRGRCHACAKGLWMSGAHYDPARAGSSADAGVTQFVNRPVLRGIRTQLTRDYRLPQLDYARPRNTRSYDPLVRVSYLIKIPKDSRTMAQWNRKKCHVVTRYGTQEVDVEDKGIHGLQLRAQPYTKRLRSQVNVAQLGDKWRIGVSCNNGAKLQVELDAPTGGFNANTGGRTVRPQRTTLFTGVYTIVSDASVYVSASDMDSESDTIIAQFKRRRDGSWAHGNYADRVYGRVIYQNFIAYFGDEVGMPALLYQVRKDAWVRRVVDAHIDHKNQRNLKTFLDASGAATSNGADLDKLLQSECRKYLMGTPAKHQEYVGFKREPHRRANLAAAFFRDADGTHNVRDLVKASLAWSAKLAAAMLPTEGRSYGRAAALRSRRTLAQQLGVQTNAQGQVTFAGLEKLASSLMYTNKNGNIDVRIQYLRWCDYGLGYRYTQHGRHSMTPLSGTEYNNWFWAFIAARKEREERAARLAMLKKRDEDRRTTARRVEDVLVKGFTVTTEFWTGLYRQFEAKAKEILKDIPAKFWSETCEDLIGYKDRDCKAIVAFLMEKSQGFVKWGFDFVKTREEPGKGGWDEGFLKTENDRLWRQIKREEAANGNVGGWVVHGVKPTRFASEVKGLTEKIDNLKSRRKTMAYNYDNFHNLPFTTSEIKGKAEDMAGAMWSLHRAIKAGSAGTGQVGDAVRGLADFIMAAEKVVPVPGIKRLLQAYSTGMKLMANSIDSIERTVHSRNLLSESTAGVRIYRTTDYTQGLHEARKIICAGHLPMGCKDGQQIPLYQETSLVRRAFGLNGNHPTAWLWNKLLENRAALKGASGEDPFKLAGDPPPMIASIDEINDSQVFNWIQNKRNWITRLRAGNDESHTQRWLYDHADLAYKILNHTPNLPLRPTCATDEERDDPQDC